MIYKFVHLIKILHPYNIRFLHKIYGFRGSLSNDDWKIYLPNLTKYCNKKFNIHLYIFTVVIDYPQDELGTSTGRFEMVYEKDFSWIGNGLLPYQFSHAHESKF